MPKQKIKRVRRIQPTANREVTNPRTGPDSKYDDIRFPGIVLSLLRHTGADDAIIGDVLGVGPKTIATWMRKHPRFKEAVKRGRDDYDTEKVERRMLEKALGYKYTNETYENKIVGYEIDEDGNKTAKFEMILTKVEHKERAPDNVLLIFWLKNRNKERWMDVHKVDKTVNYPDGPPIHNHIEQTLNMFLQTATEEQLKALEGLANQQPLIEMKDAGGTTTTQHG